MRGIEKEDIKRCIQYMVLVEKIARHLQDRPTLDFITFEKMCKESLGYNPTYTISSDKAQDD